MPARQSLHRLAASFVPLALLAATVVASSIAMGADNRPFALSLRSRTETKAGSGRFHTTTKSSEWNPKETAVIVCDMWDLHHCLNATRRGGELAPHMDAVLKAARDRGATIIHAPSSCMDSYKDHAARKRAQAVPKAGKFPEEIAKWCYKIPEEEKGKYPIDQSDGGEDDDLEEHRQWAEKLTALGRNPRAPWKSQTALLTIRDEDYISDNGEEVWSILEHHGLKNVILMGVHTNMCVLGRPFGLRQMAKNGKNVVLMRDMTDTMYNPARAPFVSHFTGTDLIVEHIEKWVCPTVTSDQIVGGKPFRFAHDTRPRLAILSAEDEYKTEETLPPFAAKYLGKDFSVQFIFGSETERSDIPGIDAINNADVLLVSVRRRPLPKAQLDVVRRFAAMGKGIVGIRTASHAFAPSIGKPTPEGLDAWMTFDGDVFGGSYSGHHGEGPKVAITAAEQVASSPIMAGVDASKLVGNGSLYKVNPISKSAGALLIGTIPDTPAEPTAWTYTRADTGRSFYTSLGHKDDFENPEFCRLLRNALIWAAGSDLQKPSPAPAATAAM
ncbi:MAG: ThuA domain-containing protein [Planctomycetaceae bacterium]|nr:ThuA domain-containing protein [Planctomycetaceae bacterium]